MEYLALFPISEILTTLKDGVSRAFRITGDVQLTGSIPSQTAIETLANAVTVPAGGSYDVPFTSQGETESWILINIDQQPWTLRARLPWTTGTYSKQNFFPQRDAHTTIYTSASAPAASILLDMAAGGGITAPTTMQEAMLYSGSYGTIIRVENGGSSPATVTVKVRRKWRN